MEKNVEKAISMLKNMLQWSDRIGSDEIYEINDVIKLLKDEKYNSHHYLF